MTKAGTSKSYWEGKQDKSGGSLEGSGVIIIKDKQ